MKVMIHAHRFINICGNLKASVNAGMLVSTTYSINSLYILILINLR